MQALTFLLHPFHKVNRALQMAYLYIRPTWIEIGHGGVDPIFQRAMDSLVQQEIDQNQSIINALVEPQHFADRIANQLILLTQVRTKRLVRFTQYHADELNKGNKRSLRKIYKHIGMVQNLRFDSRVLPVSTKKQRLIVAQKNHQIAGVSDYTNAA